MCGGAAGLSLSRAICFASWQQSLEVRHPPALSSCSSSNKPKQAHIPHLLHPLLTCCNPPSSHHPAASVKPRGVVDLSQVQDVRDGRSATGRPHSLQLKTASGGSVCYVCDTGEDVQACG